jgi:DNA-binding XRE family transcriptional regulator
MREAAFLTHDEYAKLVGVTPRTLAENEFGRANPTLATLAKIAKQFGLAVGCRLETKG